MQTNIKLGIIVGVMLATGLQAQPATLATLRSTYQNAAAIITAETHKAQAEAMVRYGSTLEALATSLKQKGDLESFMVVDAEKTRYLAEKTVPTNTPAAVADAVTVYNKQVLTASTDSDKRNVYLLKQYIAALGILIKELMVASRIDEAKATSEVKSDAEFMLAELEATMPVVTAKTNTVVKVEAAIPVQVKSVIGKWQVYYPDGRLMVSNIHEIRKDGKLVVQGDEGWSGKYIFLNAEKTKFKTVHNNGSTRICDYDRATDVITLHSSTDSLWHRVD